MAAVEEQVLEKSGYLKDAIAKNEALVLLSKRQSRLKSGIIIFKHRTIANDAVI